MSVVAFETFTIEAVVDPVERVAGLGTWRPGVLPVGLFCSLFLLISSMISNY